MSAITHYETPEVIEQELIIFGPWPPWGSMQIHCLKHKKAMINCNQPPWTAIESLIQNMLTITYHYYMYSPLSTISRYRPLLNHDSSTSFQRSPTENSQKSRLRMNMNSPALNIVVYIYIYISYHHG